MTDDYSQFQAEPSSSDLAALQTLADDLAEADLEVARIENELKEAKKRAVDLSERQIPELMDTIGLEDFTTVSGLKIEVKRTIRASIPAANKLRAFRWLEDKGHGGLIKRAVVVSFDRDQEKEAKQLREALGNAWENVKEDRKVEPSTLRSFITGQLELGEDVPLELFGAWEQRRARITSRR